MTAHRWCKKKYNIANSNTKEDIPVEEEESSVTLGPKEIKLSKKPCHTNAHL